MARSTTSPVIKPTRRELLNIAIGHITKKIREQAREVNRDAETLRQTVRALEKEKEERALLAARKPHAEKLEALRKALEPFGGTVEDYVSRDTSTAFYHYSGGISHRSVITEFPDTADIDAQIVELNERARILSNQAGDLQRQANKFDDSAFFSFVAERLPPEAGTLMDQLVVMIADATSPDKQAPRVENPTARTDRIEQQEREEYASGGGRLSAPPMIKVVVYDLNDNNKIIESNPCYATEQAKGLQKDLAEKYGAGYNVEIE